MKKEHMESDRISVKEAACMLGISQETVRWMLCKGILKIGRVVTKRESGKKQNRYMIYRHLVEKEIEKMGGEEG